MPKGQKYTQTDEIPEINKDWISATSTFNYLMKDPLIDWLKLYYRAKTDRNGTFTNHIMEQGNVFEAEVMKLISKKFKVIDIKGGDDPRSKIKIEETLAAMEKGVPIIHSGILFNPHNQTFGIPDLLVRSDYINKLVKVPIEISSHGCKFSKSWHYLIVDIKFATLLLKADGQHLLNAGCFPAYKSQLLIYNWALNIAQGFEPDQAYVLGRRWKYSANNVEYSNDTCFDKLAIIDYLNKDREFVQMTVDALTWLKEVHSPEAKDWDIYNYPLERTELYPNMCNNHDYPWHNIKEEIAKETKELTSLWMVGPKNRLIALDNDVSQWTDQDCSSQILGVNGLKTSKILSAILEVNHDEDKIIIPEVLKSKLPKAKFEFFVDFETNNGSIAEINSLPNANVENMINMIGVGFINKNAWQYKTFLVDRLTDEDEIDNGLQFAKFINKFDNPKLYHWGSHERTLWSAFCIKNNIIDNWDWVDLLQLFKNEPITIKDCLNFGLKSVAKAMFKHGLIETTWADDNNGITVMVKTYKADESAGKLGKNLIDIGVMKEIIEYNKVDVRVLYEILTYLRENHLVKRTKRTKKTKRKVESIAKLSNKKRRV